MKALILYIYFEVRNPANHKICSSLTFGTIWKDRFKFGIRGSLNFWARICSLGRADPRLLAFSFLVPAMTRAFAVGGPSCARVDTPVPRASAIHTPAVSFLLAAPGQLQPVPPQEWGLRKKLVGPWKWEIQGPRVLQLILHGGWTKASGGSSLWFFRVLALWGGAGGRMASEAL